MELFAIGFTGQVKKIWQRHIFFIFDGVREWIRGLVLKLQVGGGLVQCSNQGQIDFTCLRFRHLSAHCRHTHIYSMWARTHTPTHTFSVHSIRLTHSRLLHTSIYPRTCKTKGGFSHDINVQTQVNTLRRQIKHT